MDDNSVGGRTHDAALRRIVELERDLEASQRATAIALKGSATHADRVELMLLMRCPACNSPRHGSYPSSCAHKFHEAFYGERMPTPNDTEGDANAK